VVPQGPPAHAQAATEAAVNAECEVGPVQALAHRVSWARLLKRVFAIDMQHCPNCGSGELPIDKAGEISNLWNKWLGPNTEYKMAREEKVVPLSELKFEPLP
jgi:hypothetical protein